MISRTHEFERETVYETAIVEGVKENTERLEIGNRKKEIAERNERTIERNWRCRT
jgi:hypothetical protein